MKSQPPPAAPVPNLFYPEIQETVLSSGLTVLVITDSSLPRVTARLVVRAGRASTPPDNRSLAELTAELIKEGTPGHSSQEIAAFLDLRAIELNTDVLMEHSLLEMTMLEKQMFPGLEILAELVAGATFPPSEVAKAQRRWKSFLMAQRADPGFLANERLYSALFAEHPYSRVSFTEDELSRVTSDTLQQFLKERWNPREAILLLAGSVQLHRVQHRLEAIFGQWNSRPPEARPLPDPPQQEQSSARIIVVDRPHSVQTKILIGLIGLPRAHPDFIPLKVTNQVFGGGGSARLFLNLREDKGYTYGAYSMQQAYQHQGLLLATTDVRTESTVDSVREIFDEMHLMGRQEPGDEELSRSRAELIGAFLRKLERPDSVGTLEVSRRLFSLPVDYYRDFIRNVRNVKADEVRRMAEEFLQPDRSTVVLVADWKALKNDLKEFGEVEVYDALGGRLETGSGVSDDGGASV